MVRLQCWGWLRWLGGRCIGARCPPAPAPCQNAAGLTLAPALPSPHPPHSHAPRHAGEQDGTALEMAFSKKKVEDRKQWLQGFVPGTFLDHSVDTISYHEFVHKVWHAARGY